MKIWKETTYLSDKSYKNIEYYGSIEAEFENCTFNTVLFYWNLIDNIEFKTCTFINCIFAGVTFIDNYFIKCTFKNCKFTKGNVGLYCTAENSFCIDCKIDAQSLKNIPLTIYQEVKLLTPTFKKELYEVFKTSRPILAVNNPTHCLTCNEAQETHEELSNLKQAKVEHFQHCYISIEALSKDALLYYMPKLLELFLIGEENDGGIFISFFLSQLVPNKFGNRFEHYNKKQTELIIRVLEHQFNKYNKEEENWDYGWGIMADKSMYKELSELCETALHFWKEKYKKEEQ